MHHTGVGIGMGNKSEEDQEMTPFIQILVEKKQFFVRAHWIFFGKKMQSGGNNGTTNFF